MATDIATSQLQILDANGVPVSGAKIHVYDAGTTTPQAIYSNAALTTSAANPIIADSAGRHDMRYKATGSYKIVVTTSADTLLYTRDNIDGGVPISSGALAIANGGTGATSAAQALQNLGGVTDAEFVDLSADVATLAAGPYGKFYVKRGTDQTGMTSDTVNKITFNTESFDTNNVFDSATNFRYQPLQSGYYFITVGVTTDDNVAGIQAHILKNGTIVASGSYGAKETASSQSIVSMLVFLNGTTDYIEGGVYIPTAQTTIDFEFGTYMFGWKVSP